MNKLFIIFFYSFLIFFCKSNENWLVNNLVQKENYIVYNNFPSKFVSPRNIEVWLPKGYDNIKKLPVVYMFDGQNIFHGSRDMFNGKYNHGWQVDETLDSLFDVGKVPKIMIVGIFNTGVNRFSEYMPNKPLSKIKKMDKNKYAEKAITSNNFLKFIVEELKPFIDKNYKTIREVSGTYLAGSSMGGLISLYAICEYPNVFGGAACLSTHWLALEGVFIDYLKKNIPSPKSHKIYYDFGTLGLDKKYEPFQLIVDSIMIKNGYKENINWLTKKFEGEDHNEKFWRNRFHYAIEFLFK